MRTIHAGILVAVAALALAGCKKDADDAAPTATEAAAMPADAGMASDMPSADASATSDPNGNRTKP